jgi:hypothetical protein
MVHAGLQGQPDVAAAIEVHELAEARPRLATATMAAPGAALGDQPGALQGALD